MTPAAAFLSGLKDRHDLSETKFLVGGYGCLTALARCDLSGDLEYADRNTIEK
jgi:putative transposase